MRIWLWKKFLAKKFIADVYIDKIYGASCECMIVDISKMEEGKVGVQYYVEDWGYNTGPIVLWERQCYYRNGLLLWDP